MKITIAISQDSTITEPTLLTVGSGIVDAKFPSAYSKQDVIRYIDAHLKENKSEISKKIKADIAEYQKKWEDRIHTILKEYNSGVDLEFSVKYVKISPLKSLYSIKITGDGYPYDLQITFDPIISLLPEEVIDAIFREEMIRAMLNMSYKAISRIDCLLRILFFTDGDIDPAKKEAEMDRLKVLLQSFEEKKDIIYDECEKVRLSFREAGYGKLIEDVLSIPVVTMQI